MIISCEKCNKKFELDTSLIPNTGRLLQCGSCSHKWHYKPKKTIVSRPEPVKINKYETQDNIIIEDNADKNSQDIKIPKKNELKKKVIKNLKKNNLLNILVVIVISFIALILVIETFKFEISKLIPNIDFYLNSLYETVKDIYLFFKDLLK